MSNRELKTAASRLSAENRREIRRMAVYLQAHYLNEVAYEETMSDLVGMALECQQRGEPFSSAIGTDYREFCRALIQNIPRQTPIERVLDSVQYIWYALAAVVPILYLVKLAFGNMSPAVIDGLRLTAPVPFVLKYCTVAMTLVIGLVLMRLAAYRSRKLVVTVYLAAVVFVFVAMDLLSGTFVTGYGYKITILLPVWLLIFGGLLLLCKVGKRLAAMTVAYTNRKKEEKGSK